MLESQDQTLIDDVNDFMREEGGCGDAKAGGLHNQGGTMTLNDVAVLANSVFGDPASGGWYRQRQDRAVSHD